MDNNIFINMEDYETNSSWFSELKEAEIRHLEENQEIEKIRQEYDDDISEGVNDYINHIERLKEQKINYGLK